ncbi:hypothetical protein DL98DRAFT_512206 [Cadophora sp. DSE1049]|nr:hypothetical protein DL98DRAFT_512206 [Cadophora sp. DSE1049]
MRTSTQFLSGLGFLALLAPASAQSSNSDSFEASSAILPTFQSTTEASSTTTEVPSTQTSSEVSSFTTPSPSLSSSFIPTSASESSLPSSFGNQTSSSTSASSSATPSVSPTAPFFLTVQVVPGLKKRQVTSGTPYLSLVGGQLVATQSCSEFPPVAFSIDADRLRVADSFATVTAATVAAPGFSALQFGTTAAATDIQTVFAVDTVGSLSWTNAAFLNGDAQFCLLNNVLQAAYTVPVASIPDCVPVLLVRSFEVCTTPSTNIVIGVEITIEITIINITNVINGVTVTTTSTETKTITSPLTGTPAPVVSSSVKGNGTEYFTTTVACGQCQYPGYIPGQLTVYQTKTVCPVCVASTITPVVATVVPCSSCQPLVPGPAATQTNGDNPYTALVPAVPGQQTPYVSGTAVKGQPTMPVTYAGGAATVSAKGAVFGILVGLLLSLC